jgi:NAD(P)-dependent dehydrogenase (short-subunit alcohol dehydrogenase family)
MKPSYDFRDRVALVTVAGAGMGFDTARAFAASGATVVLADVDQDALNRATDELTSAGHRALAVTCDVADEAQAATLVERTVAKFGRLDMAFNNAVCPGTIETPMVADMITKGELTVADAEAGQPIGRLGRGDEIATPAVL